MDAVERVLVAYDGTPLATEALEHALGVYPETAIVVLHVIDYVEESYSARALVGPDRLADRARERSERLLESATAIAASHDRSVETRIRVGKAAAEIVAAADSLDADVIVIGSHGRSGLSRAILGSVAETVIRRAAMPVTVVR